MGNAVGVAVAVAVAVILALLAAAPAIASHNVGALASSCEESDFLYKSLPCVKGGTVMSTPSSQCCVAVRAMALECLCRLIVSATGASSEQTVKNYVKTCKMKAPPGFKC
ncbi:hypothetical protein SELMODRAFT_430505 [Selaginella moellendorffii]|uniref:Bifunctional inhibitor/plant lipid transfer protein/seed storage helical domain-containing protein n=1 Tax=Selaginella moellendorffii TaxID=88036 RepID=D8T9M2_SELML|nr:hypothetical protein SELMODRAFT_430505 [Selaginella moellendorffii]